MFRLSNNLVGILNLVTFLLSLPILGVGIWLSNRANTDCERFLEKPVIALAVFLLVVSLAGLVGACCGVSCLLWLYLLLIFLLIVILFCFTMFAFVVTNEGAGRAVSDRGYKEYRLGDYSNWLQKRVANTKNWNKIKSCLADGMVCTGLAYKSVNDTIEQFYKEHLSAVQEMISVELCKLSKQFYSAVSIVTSCILACGLNFNAQSGCCKPSDDCGFTYISPTVWNLTVGTATSSNSDCSLWSNDPKVLCYNCQSCKAGLLDNIKSDWKKVAVCNIVFLIVLIIVYSFGCCAFRNNLRR
ncbi:hypothetical protein SAY86_031232 [Trapa natans]|uniref:Tetraspanin-8 n=1 Tax=Trapa natans TaxID=22666 RepID=A0AAN7R3D1_TRANT|nr:hypothetical protein SAY86_031232 [Trapa natans]